MVADAGSHGGCQMMMVIGVGENDRCDVGIAMIGGSRFNACCLILGIYVGL